MRQRTIKYKPMKPDSKGLRSKDYLTWIRRLPCCICNSSAYLSPWHFQDMMTKSEPDHLPVPGLKAVGMKSPDYFTIPLCREHHIQRAAIFRRSHRIVTPDENRIQCNDIRWVNVNLYEIVSRLMWHYFTRDPYKEGGHKWKQQMNSNEKGSRLEEQRERERWEQAGVPYLTETE